MKVNEIENVNEKMYRIRSNDQWYIGKYGFSANELNGAWFTNLENAEKTIRREKKNYAEHVAGRPNDEYFANLLSLWNNAVVVEYELVRVRN